MLTGIIKDKKSGSPSTPINHEPSENDALDPKKSKKRESPKSDDSSPERLKTKVMESLKKKKSKDTQIKEESEE